MPKGRPPASGYARLAQADEDDEQYLEDSDRDDPNRAQPTLSADRQYAGIQPGPRADRMQSSHRQSSHSKRRTRRNSGVDLKALNARLERWADEIASKFKLKKGSGKHTTEHLEIQHSVFQAPDWIRPATQEQLNTALADPPGLRMSSQEYDDIVESVRLAIEQDVHPTLISKGSSGSYFARNSSGKIVGVFKPKDEEPYASRNPKWTKWIHRNLFPCFFGRACLIPNLSYVSEAAAYVLDTQLRCNLVPYTDVVGFSSKSFHYDFWERRAFYRRKKPLPEKLGSLQVFLKGYTDATTFFTEHPWPDQTSSGVETNPKKKRRWADDCRKGTVADDEENQPLTSEESERRRTFWTEGIQLKLRFELEKLVILDYIMRNTDRGSDNWMIHVDEETQDASIIIEPPNGHIKSPSAEPYNRPVESMIAASRTGTPMDEMLDNINVRIGAIDNSLSWPWKHPDAWRSYPFGWLFLPVSLIGQPFSEATRIHFLPLLTSKAWWQETQLALRKCFMRDSDFQERMFLKQMAIIKGQAWNVVETLKSPDHGPLELTRRARVCVWDDLVEVPVAVPLRPQSTEVLRKAAVVHYDDEMDISAAGNASAAPPVTAVIPTKEEAELVTFSSPERERSNPFNMSRQSSQLNFQDDSSLPNRTLSPPNVLAMSNSVHSAGGLPHHSSTSRPGHKARMSFDESRRYNGSTRNKRRQHTRRFSASAQLGNPFGDDGDDEGDLGYAATADREANRKQVIVERLENVKGKNPVFSWC